LDELGLGHILTEIKLQKSNICLFPQCWLLQTVDLQKLKVNIFGSAIPNFMPVDKILMIN